MPSFFIQNFGCRVNQAEAFDWADTLQAAGLRIEEDWSRCELVIVNSCTLTGRADRDVRKFILKVGRVNPGAKLVVTGCYAEREREELARRPAVSLVLSNSEKGGLAARVLSLMGKPGGDVEHSAGVPSHFRARALVKVQDGCDNRCAFCVIPSVRGRSVSVGFAEALRTVKSIVAHGYREIVLAGIHLSSWGDDLGPRRSLADLLQEIEAIEGLGRLRLSSLDPRRMSRALITHIAGNPKICQHFHLSLQHASERILARMGRAEGARTADHYESVLALLREGSPEAALGADVIVGFPDESDEDFAILESFLDRSPLTYFHVFSYSPRQDTPAAARPQVPDRVKTRRSAALRRLSAEKNLTFRRSLLGQEFEAVVIRKRGGCEDESLDAGAVESFEEETTADAPSQGLKGRGGITAGAEVLTGNYIKVLVPHCETPERELVWVRVTGVLPRTTEGRII